MITKPTGTASEQRLAIKTPEAAFLQVLQEEFKFSQRVSGEVLQAVEEMLLENAARSGVRPGQMRLMAARERAPFGASLSQTAQVEVTLTVDAGAEDLEVKRRDGAEGLRRSRILRVIDEALEQGGVLTQEDLGRALSVGVRTIRRDIQVLKRQDILIHTRGQLKGVGRGQTHKVKIIGLWLDRLGYEQIGRKMHHSGQAIKRYVGTFMRIVLLHERGTPMTELAFLTQCSRRLVGDYLREYHAALVNPQRQAKLQEELSRLQSAVKMPESEAKKGGEGI